MLLLSIIRNRMQDLDNIVIFKPRTRMPSTKFSTQCPFSTIFFVLKKSDNQLADRAPSFFTFYTLSLSVEMNA
ncbi:hypothetical protein DSUL_20158 [Desulfovibrionales bacterium]